MYKIKISTDSTSDIPKALAQELNISILPLTIQVQGRGVSGRGGSDPGGIL